MRITEWIKVEALPLRSLYTLDFAVARLADGSWLTVPVHIAVGNRPRPRLVALAGIHGDEPEGMLALLDLWKSCDPTGLEGAVILVPVANPPAFAAHQRRSALDDLDLNRIFPGKPDGTPSEQLAYRLLHDVIAGTDLVFTLHSWYATGMVVPYVEFMDGDDPVSKRSFEAAKAAGFTRLRKGEWPEGVLGLATHALGVPLIGAEIGGHGMSTPENRAQYVEHLNRLLQHLGILPGVPPSNAAPEIYTRGQLFAPAGGMLHLEVAAGDHVQAGTLLATITDLHGEPIAEMRAPQTGLIAAVRHYVSVNPGDHVFAFFRPIT
ncbi:MAG TPA: succinylglutamate desuccinylase/aspartoacylase family protein [Candidatus Methylomirabilis sp.]|nr:succinylglutamate desuccinylase/aspartoacylase family protein [Candidatus Methylomirabilis sp.]